MNSGVFGRGKGPIKWFIVEVDEGIVGITSVGLLGTNGGIGIGVDLPGAVGWATVGASGAKELWDLILSQTSSAFGGKPNSLSDNKGILPNLQANSEVKEKFAGVAEYLLVKEAKIPLNLMLESVG